MENEGLTPSALIAPTVAMPSSKNSKSTSSNFIHTITEDSPGESTDTLASSISNSWFSRPATTNTTTTILNPLSPPSGCRSPLMSISVTPPLTGTTFPATTTITSLPVELVLPPSLLSASRSLSPSGNAETGSVSVASTATGPTQTIIPSELRGGEAGSSPGWAGTLEISEISVAFCAPAHLKPAPSSIYIKMGLEKTAATSKGIVRRTPKIAPQQLGSVMYASWKGLWSIKASDVQHDILTMDLKAGGQLGAGRLLAHTLVCLKQIPDGEVTQEHIDFGFGCMNILLTLKTDLPRNPSSSNALTSPPRQRRRRTGPLMDLLHSLKDRIRNPTSTLPTSSTTPAVLSLSDSTNSPRFHRLSRILNLQSFVTSSSSSTTSTTTLSGPTRSNTVVMVESAPPSTSTSSPSLTPPCVSWVGPTPCGHFRE